MTQMNPANSKHTAIATAPAWLMRWTGRLALFGGFSLAFLLMVFAAGPQGLIALALTLILVPLLGFFISLIWRYFWYLVTALLFLMIVAILGTWWRVSMSDVSLPEWARGLRPLIRPSNPFGFMLALVLAGLVTATVTHIYSLWSHGGFVALRARLMGRRSEVLFDFDAPGPSSSLATTSLGERVMQHLQQTGHRGEAQGDLIHVFKRREFVGIVRVVESAGAISPVIVRDVEKQRTKLGVKVAYLATAGWFTEDVRQMADQMGVKLITV